MDMEPREPVVWADEMTPFTGPQVRELMAENNLLRVHLAGVILAYRMDDDLFALDNAVLAAAAYLNSPTPVEPATDAQ
jgi:hypothetical protein